ncbi:MAG: class I SAM-dependent methyltransferase, partial [Nocardioides sp.]
MTGVVQPGSSSVDRPDYWWFAARGDLLDAGLRRWLGAPRRVLDVGSADAPSAAWLQGDHEHVSVDLDARGLVPGRGVCASALALP